MQAKHQVKGGLFVDVVVTQGTPIFKQLASKVQALLVWGDAHLVLDLGPDIFDGVISFHFKSDGLAGEGLDEDLHTTTVAKHQEKGGLFQDVAVTQGTPIFKLPASKDQALLVWGDALLFLDLGLDIFDGVRSHHLKREFLASEGLDKDLHTTTVVKHQGKGGLSLDVVVTQGTPIFKLPASKDQALLIWVDALLVLDLGLDISDGVRSFHFKSDGLACTEDLDEHEHTITVAKRQVKGGLFLDVVVIQGMPIFKLPAKEQVLLVWGDAHLVLDHEFDIFNGIRSFHFKRDGLACREGLHKDLHTTM